ncbi:MORN repeat variant [Chitinophaga sp. YR573]|uniref:toxin-antitoxin system YwqK family antitoxin n=1 Tax=Chitinophaga sp. YR573 TaxID=1881040 RepID=UPI0008D4DC35|nr:hypothetical protein [Chitinophaga sp. YR573]SEW38718.1 MORN repeat variant [Chitinophaga sp. YR573]
MRQLFILSFLQLMMFAAFAQEKTNQVDAQKHKQGPWSEQMPEVKGEPGYTWEGNYVNDFKEGMWKKYAESGGIIAEETYKHGVLNGHCRYFYSNGLVSAEGSFIAVDIDGQKDTYRVIDPITGEERMEEIARTSNSLRNGIWKIYDEEGHVTKEYYKRGQPVSPEELDTLAPSTPQKTAPVNFLPHQTTGGKKSKH